MTTIAGRPREFDEVEVLDRAVDVFWSRGFRSTTTRDLEETLGLSQSSLYNAYGSKLGVFLAAIERYEEKTAAAVLDPLDGAPNGLAGLDRFFAHLATWVTADGRRGCLMINLMAEDDGESAQIAARTAAYRDRVRTSIRGALQRAAHDGDVPADLVEERTDLLFGAALGVNIAARAGSSVAEVTRIADATRHLVASWAG